MGVIEQGKIDRIKQLLKWHPRGMTISDLSTRFPMNRNLMAKYLDLLLISGQVEMQVIGAAKVYFLTHRIPISAMLEFSSDLVIMLDADARILQVNEPVLLLFDVKKDALIGKRIHETEIPFIRDLPVNGIPENFRSGGESGTEISYMIQGKRHAFRMKRIPAVFEDGSQGITFIIEDITVRNTYQEKLKESEERFRSVTEVSPFPMSIIDPCGCHLFLNRSFVTTFGYTQDEIPDGKNWVDRAFPDPADKEKAIKFWHTGPTGTPKNEPKPQRFPIHCKNGTVRNVYFIPVDLLDGSRVFVGRDVTEQEEALRLRDLLASIIQSSDEALIELTREGRIASWNPAAERMYGYHDDEVLRNPFGLLVPPGHQDDLEIFMRRVWQGEYIQRHEMKMIRKNGAVMDALITITTIKGSEGGIAGASSIVRDITKEKMEQHLREFEDRYRTLVEDINVGIYRSTADPHGRFVWGNTALLNILGYHSMVDLQEINIIDVFSEPDKRKQLLEELHRNGFVKNRILPLKKKDGTQIAVCVTALAEFDEKRQVTLINGIVQDITGYINAGIVQSAPDSVNNLL